MSSVIVHCLIYQMRLLKGLVGCLKEKMLATQQQKNEREKKDLRQMKMVMMKRLLMMVVYL